MLAPLDIGSRRTFAAFDSDDRPIFAYHSATISEFKFAESATGKLPALRSGENILAKSSGFPSANRWNMSLSTAIVALRNKDRTIGYGQRHFAQSRSRGSGARCSSVTMMDVAKLAEVSPSTVSLYLRKPEAVSPAASQVIARAIDTLGYVPNLVAGGLGRSELAGRQHHRALPSATPFSPRPSRHFRRSLQRKACKCSSATANMTKHPGRGPGAHGFVLGPRGDRADRPGHSDSDPTSSCKSSRHPGRRDVGARADEPIDMAVGFSHPQVGALQRNISSSKGRRNLAFLGARMQEDRRAAQRAAGFEEACARVLRSNHQPPRRRDGRGRRAPARPGAPANPGPRRPRMLERSYRAWASSSSVSAGASPSPSRLP